MNKKLKQIIGIFLIELIIFLPIAMADSLTISNVRAEDTTQISTKIRWETNNNAESYVSYGTTEDLSQTSTSRNFVKHHSISLLDLQEDTAYFFAVTSEDGETQLTDDNNNNLYEFTTLSREPLFINVTIPENQNERELDISGRSIRATRINLYVNNNAPRKVNANNKGVFYFPDLAVNEGPNTIRITAESQGQTIEKSYSVNIDTVDPIVTLEEIPYILGEERITIKGSADEPVTISFYVQTGEEDIDPPPKVLNLTNTSVQQNRVDLNWNIIEAEDFQQYIVYRNNRPLGVGPDSGYNDYSDILANSNRTYTYQVAAMDKHGNIGEKSDPLTIRTPAGGRTDLPQEDVDIYESINSPQKTISVDSEFQEDIDLGRKDGFYDIAIIAEDIAGNQWQYESTHLLDTTDPEIEILSPKGNAQIYENYADMVTIRGKTEPGTRLYMYVKRTPFGALDNVADISGYPDQIQDIPETDLRANCRLEIEGEQQCSTHSDYETVADANGYFEFEDIDLTSMWAGALRITQYPTGEPYYDAITERELRDFLESQVFFVAVDPAGRRGIEQVDYEIVTCYSSSLDWDAIELIEYQSPTFLSAERLKEGTESIYFYFNFTYHGLGNDARITNLRVEKACGRGYLEGLEEYTHSCEILRSCSEKLSPNGKTAYIACPLGRIEGMESWSDDQWENFINGVANEMIFPFKMTLYYEEELENNTIDYSKTHYLCRDVAYAVDAVKINPKEVLPDWLLYDFVEFLNETIHTLNDWIDTLKQILEWTAIACIVSFFVKFVTQIVRRITCSYDRFFKKLEQMGDSDKESACRMCIESHETAQVLAKFDNKQDVQDLISDTCLKECYPSCSNAWQSEETMYKTYRWSCDRVFGHPTPSKWTEKSSDTELYQKLSEGKSCSNDQSVRGRPLRAVDCIAVEEKYRIKGTFNRDEKCLEITSHSGNRRTETLYHIDEPYSEGESVYKISKMDTSAPSLTYDLVIKQNEDNYMAPMEQSCEQICKGELTGERVQIGLQTAGGKIQMQDKDNVRSQVIEEDEEGNYYMTFGCITPNQCISYRSGDVKQLQIENKDEYVDVKTAVPMGYTRDCFDPQYVSGDPDRRIECCCINSQAGASPEYFQPGDIENKDGEFSNDGFENMKWSYRYSKLEKSGGYKNKKYNPNRYTDGRDQMACFGQNHWLYDGFSGSGSGNLLIVDPAAQHIAAFQCLAISHILNRLQLIKNIMGALQNCLLSIRLTGEADTGVCKEIFSQYICSLIWRVISWFRDGCLPFGKGIDFTKSENKILEAVSIGMDGIWDSVADTQQELNSEYGNAQLNNLIGLGEQDLARKVCLLAFGYDWEMDADSLLDVAYHTPYATLVQAVLPSREYLTFDPTTYYAKYDYRASWMINPGCDLEGYDVHLACVTRAEMQNNGDIDCSKQSDPYGKNCDCLDISQDQAPSTLLFYQSRGRIKQNELQNIDSSQITDRIKSSPYRYDHLVFRLRVDRNFERNDGDPSKCFPTGHEDGIFYFPITDNSARDVAGCQSDITSGRFSCREGASFFYEEGNAWFTEIKVADSTTTNIQNPLGATYYAGDTPSISADIRYQKDSRKQCLITRLFDQEHRIITTRFETLNEGQLGGEISLGNLYSLGQEHITGGGYGFTVDYVDENGRTIPATAKLKYSPQDKATKEGNGGPLIFLDDSSNGQGIKISRDSTDTYIYGNRQKKISESYSGGNAGGRFEIELEDMGASMTVDRVYPTSEGKYEFFISYIATPEHTSTLDPKFYLYLDLRNPKTADGDCDEVAGAGYDNIQGALDDSQIIVANGIKQKVEIPIYIVPGESSTTECDSKYERREQISGTNNQCACAGTRIKDCPKENREDDPDDDFRYCYGVCRKYPRCEFNEPLSLPCVCDPNIESNLYDCGGKSTGDDSRFSGISREGWYCYEQQGIGHPTCNINPPSGTQSGPQDLTPLSVTLEKPYTGLEVLRGEDLKIRAIIEDDMPDGEEEYEIVVNAEPIKAGQNIDKESRWVIEYDLKVTQDPPKVLNIFVRGIDESMASGSKTMDSRTARVNVVAQYSP